MRTNVLRGKAVEQYGSLSNLAHKLGWSSNKMSRIINSKQAITLNDTLQIASALNIEKPSEFLDIFLPEITQM